ncbi:MAG: beta-ketoacyl-[acyl-carrier-protein] synthase family protein [Planctomycetota bacterium]|jgi:3-oxoacyl-[acyl-carrier-protein] synthase II
MDVAITGAGIISAMGVGAAVSREGLRTGRSFLRPCDTLDLPLEVTRPLGRVPAGAEFGLTRPDGRSADRGRALLQFATAAAAAQSGRAFDEPGRFAVGTTLAGMVTGTAMYRDWRDGQAPRRVTFRDYLPSDQAGVVAEANGFAGGVQVISDACAGGANAIGLAARAVELGLVPWAVAGGYDPLCAFVVAGFDSLMALAHEQCTPFDANRTGLALGEGAGFVVLERTTDARARGATIYGRVTGYGASSDAYHITKPHPQGDGAARAMRTAIADAGIAPGDLRWVKAHGTATPPNDAMESAAITAALGDAAGAVPVSSLKGTIGHTLGGAGAVETLLALICMQDGFAPPSVGLETPDPCTEGLDLIQREPRAIEPGPVLCNAFGFGGSNASLVVEPGEVVL